MALLGQLLFQGRDGAVEDFRCLGEIAGALRSILAFERIHTVEHRLLPEVVRELCAR